MRWNPFDVISPAIKKTKLRLFPFNFKEWLKLMIISVLAGIRGGNFNFNSPSLNLKNGSVSESPDISGSLREGIKKYWIIGGIIALVFFLLITVLTYIRSVFSFIFIESLINKESKFTFRKNHSKGVSLFLFKFIISIITLVTIICLAYPYIHHFTKANPILASVGVSYIIFSILALIVYFLALWVLFLFLEDFAIPYMYSKEVPAVFALKEIWKVILKNKIEVLVYWLARLLLSIGVAIISILIGIIVILAILILGGIIFLIGFLIYKLAGGLVILAVLGIILGLVLLLTLIVSILMLILPLSVFFRYFQLFNFEKLTRIKILKDF